MVTTFSASTSDDFIGSAVPLSGPEVLVTPLGTSYKLTLDELADVTDWSKLEVTGVQFTRRGNVLYLSGAAAGTYSVTIGYDGNPVKSVTLEVTP